MWAIPLEGGCLCPSRMGFLLEFFEGLLTAPCGDALSQFVNEQKMKARRISFQLIVG